MSWQSDLQTALDAKGTSNFSGAYADLTGKPTLGTAAATASTDYATAAQGTLATNAVAKSANLSDLANVGTARTNLGLGTLATQNGTFSGTSSGTNTGDQTSVSGNAGTATALQTPRLLNGVSFNGTADVTVPAGLTATGTFGYAAGAGGTVTQLTSKATGVTLNKLCGTITLHNAALAAAATVTFTVTNSTVAATDVMCVQHDSVGAIGSYTVMPNTSAAGSFKISLRNNTAGSLSEAIVLRFAVIKAVTS